MISLKRRKTKTAESIGVPSSAEDYPWGTRLRFDSPEIEKIGGVLGKAVAGDEVRISAVGKIIEVRVQADGAKSKHQSVEIQITKISITGKNSDDPTDEKEAFDE